MVLARRYPLHVTLAISGSVHLGLMALLLWTASKTLNIQDVVEVSYFDPVRTAISVPEKPKVARVKTAEALPAPIPEAQEVRPETIAPSTPNANERAQYETYAMQVARALNAKKIYPEISLKLRQQGRVKVRFRVNRDGHVLNAEILERSAHDPLNSAAKRLIDEIRILPPFPEDVKETTWLFTVPIEYTM